MVSVSISDINPIHHNAVFNYLFNYDNVGLKGYAAAPLFDDAILIVSEDGFYWLLQNLADFEILKPFIKNLPNHCIFVQNVSETITSNNLFFNSGSFMEPKDYIYFMKNSKD